MGSSSKSINDESLSQSCESGRDEERQKKSGLICTPALMLITAIAIIAILVLSCVSTYLITRAQFKHLSEVKNHTQSREKLQKPTFSIMEELRLPRKLKPVFYNLVIKVYLPFYVDFPADKNLTTDGEVVIDIVVLQPTNEIILNMKEIRFLSDKCEAQSNGAHIPITSIKVDDHLERVVFILAETLDVNQNVRLKVIFRGVINDGLSGMYRTFFEDAQGKMKIAAVTQFESADARRMVPCFDEPAYKAAWNVTVIHPKGTTAIANGFEISETLEPDGKWKVSTFRQTPVMSSYLVAIFVSEFDFDESYTKRGVRFRLWSPPKDKPLRKYGLETAVIFMETFEKYFGIEDVVMKQDLVAVEDFSAGAMENWGLITFSGDILLSLFSLLMEDSVQRKVIAHELAHQWFGNLVTMNWWDELWLKEGFASYFENIELNENRDMRISKTEHVTSFNSPMKKDSLAASRPLSSIIDIPLEISESYDSLSYSKGGIIIAMIRDVVGEQNFRKALIHYLKKFSFENTRGNDLWKAFDEAVEGVEGPDGGKLSMVDFGPQWSKQMGLPLVTVEHFNSTTLKIGQERYMKVPHAAELQKYRNSAYKWDVPLWYQWDDKQVYYKWLKREEPLYLDRKEAPIVINVDRRGYFIQNYDSDGWKKITRQFEKNHEVYSPHTRYTVISDAFSAALIGQLDYKTVFALLKYLSKEEDSLVWNAVTRGFDTIKNLLGDESGRKWVDLYSKKIMERKYRSVYSKYISGEFETHGNSGRALHQARRYGKKKHYKSTSGMSRYSSSLRLKFATSVIESYCEAGSNNCSSTFQSLFERGVLERCTKGRKASQCVKISSHLRKLTYCYGVKQIGTAAVEKVKELYNNEDNRYEKDNLAKGMGCAQKIEELKSLLRDEIKKTERNAQRIVDVFVTVSVNPVSREFLINFLIENWEAIYEKLGNHNNHGQLSAVIGACLGGMHSNAEIMLVKLFQKSNPNAQQFRIINERIEEAEHTIAWLKKHSQKLIEFFKSELGQTETFF
ncbi:hypothetical protein RB195_016180 [Necator americanus]|uniref:Aminopeptidase n=1 Tax=Necator americanus TaxID=51031 RepID=A0ABR1E7Y1_NECAM